MADSTDRHRDGDPVILTEPLSEIERAWLWTNWTRVLSVLFKPCDEHRSAGAAPWKIKFEWDGSGYGMPMCPFHPELARDAKVTESASKGPNSV